MVIRMRHTRSHTGNRRSHHALSSPNLATCSNCGAKHRPHHMCADCGFYKGRMVMDLKAKKDAREARLQAKRDMIKAEQATPDTADEAGAVQTAETNVEKAEESATAETKKS